MADPPPPAPQLGRPDRIGRYRIVSRVARGAMGVVYSAVDEVMGRPVALKVLMADLETDPETRTRFHREAEAAARLLHPNVITVYDAGEDQGRSFIAMQLLEGAPLPTYLKRPEAESLERKLDLMIQVCEGLAAAHAEGIIHRDLKPNNLFVQSDGVLKILDFGVARLKGSDFTVVGTMIGTPDYMSPEQARGEPVDVRSDIFSAGAVFYFMLAGRKPFPGPDLPAIYRQLQFEEPAPLRGVPPELGTLVMQAMAKNRDHRPTRVEQLLADLVRFRRQYQADTRRIAVNLRLQFEELETLAESLRQTTSDLALSEGEVDVLEETRRAHPFLTAQGANEPMPSERNVLGAIAHKLEAHRDSLSATLEIRYGCLAQVQDGEQALSAGDARGAVAAFEAALADCPGSARAGDLLRTAKGTAAQQEHRAGRIRELLAAARRALQVRDFAAAQAHCHAARRLDSKDRAITALTEEVEQAVAAEQRRVLALVQEALDRAVEAMDSGLFDEAEVALDEAALLQPDSPALAAARHRLAQDRAAAEAAEHLRQLSVDGIRRARAAFRRSRYDDAIRQLDSFLALEPNADLVADELEHLRGLKSNIDAFSATAEARVRESMAKAMTAKDREAFEEAYRALGEALRWDPTNAAASEMLDEVLTRELDVRVARERARTREQRLAVASTMFAAATAARDRGYLDVALRAAQAAQRLAPDVANLAPFVEHARHELAVEDVEAYPLESTPLASPQDAQGTEMPEPGTEVGLVGWVADLFRTGLRKRGS